MSVPTAIEQLAHLHSDFDDLRVGDAASFSTQASLQTGITSVSWLLCHSPLAPLISKSFERFLPSAITSSVPGS